jgi:hypothetical protein
MFVLLARQRRRQQKRQPSNKQAGIAKHSQGMKILRYPNSITANLKTPSNRTYMYRGRAWVSEFPMRARTISREPLHANFVVCSPRERYSDIIPIGTAKCLTTEAIRSRKISCVATPRAMPLAVSSGCSSVVPVSLMPMYGQATKCGGTTAQNREILSLHVLSRGTYERTALRLPKALVMQKLCGVLFLTRSCDAGH